MTQKPTSILVTTGDSDGDITIARSGQGECQVSAAQYLSLNAWFKLRMIGQKLNKELSNLV